MHVFLPSATCIELSDDFCLSSSELEEVVLEEDWHLRFTVIGTLQLSKYLQKKKTEKERKSERQTDRVRDTGKKSEREKDTEKLFI